MGAKLEAIGQLRDIFPYHIVETLTVTPTYVAAGGTTSPLTTTHKMPFNQGPDRSSRVFVCINGVYIRIKADSYTGTPVANGTLVWNDKGTTCTIAAITQALTGPTAINLPDTRLIATMPLFGESVNDVGSVTFLNDGSALGGTATTITFTISLNMGYYNDYAEPNGCCEHHSDMVKHLEFIARNHYNQ